ncbi:MAG: M24 family metallopeptidase [Acidobacteriota bacterium]
MNETRSDGEGGEISRKALRQDLIKLLDEAGVEALLVVADAAQDVDLAPFVGEAHLRRSFLLAPRVGEPRLGFASPMEREEAAATGWALLTPEELGAPQLRLRHPRAADQLAGMLNQAFLLTGLRAGTVALAGHAGGGEIYEACRQLEASGFAFVDGGELVRRLRKRKGAADLTAARHSAAGAVAAFRRVAAVLAGSAPGADGELNFASELLTVARLRREIAAVLAGLGLSQPDGNIVAPGGEGAVPHNAGSDERVLRRGESLIVDLYPKGATLYADCTRTFCVGEPPPELAQAHGAVLDALRLAHREAKPGKSGHLVDDSVCELLEERGYATLRTDPDAVEGYVHRLGHGVGLELHEYPAFAAGLGPAGALELGDLITLEPGLYRPSREDSEGWGVRLEDLVYLAAEGSENLTPLPYDLDPRAWQTG